jgi:hypothetical protein
LPALAKLQLGVDLLERADAALAAPRAAERTGWLYSVAGVLTAVALYGALHITARLLASSNLGEDDPLDAILTQTLAIGYIPRQPPLYDWVLWLVEQVAGVGALPFQLIKYGLLTATCAFIFVSARRAMRGDAFWAFLSVESLALIYQISWRFHEGFTHAVAAMCAVAATLWAMLRLIESRRAGDYALFGLCAGLGLLTVTTFWVYLAVLIAAAALQDAGRRAVLRPAFLVSIAIALAIAAPWLIWLAGTPEGIGAILPVLAIGEAGYAQRALEGLGRAFTEPVLYLAPLIFIYPIFFPAFLKTAWQTLRLAPGRSEEASPEKLILHVTLLNVGALVAGALLFGIDSYPTHALMPLFLITSIWLTAQARKAARNEGEVRRFVIAAAGIAVFAFAARCANMYVQQPVCQICRWGIPYAELAEAIKAQGFDRGDLIVYDDDLGGNLRRFFPHARIVLAGPRLYSPPSEPPHPGERTAVLWESGKRQGGAMRHLQAAMPQLSPAALAQAETLSLPWRHHLWKPDGHRVSQWRLLITDQP